MFVIIFLMFLIWSNVLNLVSFESFLNVLWEYLKLNVEYGDFLLLNILNVVNLIFLFVFFGIFEL